MKRLILAAMLAVPFAARAQETAAPQTASPEITAGQLSLISEQMAKHNAVIFDNFTALENRYVAISTAVSAVPDSQLVRFSTDCARLTQEQAPLYSAKLSRLEKTLSAALEREPNHPLAGAANDILAAIASTKEAIAVRSAALIKASAGVQARLERNKPFLSQSRAAGKTKAAEPDGAAKYLESKNLKALADRSRTDYYSIQASVFDGKAIGQKAALPDYKSTLYSSYSGSASGGVNSVARISMPKPAQPKIEVPPVAGEIYVAKTGDKQFDRDYLAEMGIGVAAARAAIDTQGGTAAMREARQKAAVSAALSWLKSAKPESAAETYEAQLKEAASAADKSAWLDKTLTMMDRSPQGLEEARLSAAYSARLDQLGAQYAKLKTHEEQLAFAARQSEDPELLKRQQALAAFYRDNPAYVKAREAAAGSMIYTAQNMDLLPEGTKLSPAELKGIAPADATDVSVVRAGIGGIQTRGVQYADKEGAVHFKSFDGKVETTKIGGEEITLIKSSRHVSDVLTNGIWSGYSVDAEGIKAIADPAQRKTAALEAAKTLTNGENAEPVARYLEYMASKKDAEVKIFAGHSKTQNGAQGPLVFRGDIYYPNNVHSEVSARMEKLPEAQRAKDMPEYGLALYKRVETAPNQPSSSEYLRMLSFIGADVTDKYVSQADVKKNFFAGHSVVTDDKASRYRMKDGKVVHEADIALGQTEISRTETLPAQLGGALNKMSRGFVQVTAGGLSGAAAAVTWGNVHNEFYERFRTNVFDNDISRDIGKNLIGRRYEEGYSAMKIDESRNVERAGDEMRDMGRPATGAMMDGIMTYANSVPGSVMVSGLTHKAVKGITAIQAARAAKNAATAAKAASAAKKAISAGQIIKIGSQASKYYYEGKYIGKAVYNTGEFAYRFYNRNEQPELYYASVNKFTQTVLNAPRTVNYAMDLKNLWDHMPHRGDFNELARKDGWKPAVYQTLKTAQYGLDVAFTESIAGDIFINVPGPKPGRDIPPQPGDAEDKKRAGN